MVARRPVLTDTPAPPIRYAGFVAGAGWFAAWLVAAAVVAALLSELTTGATPIPGLPAPTAAVQFGIPTMRVLLDVAVVATMGLGLLAKLLGFDDPDRTEPVMLKARRIAVWTSWAWVAAALLSVVMLSAELNPDRFPARTAGWLDILTAPLSVLQYVITSPDVIWQYVVNVPAGKGLLVTAGFGLASVWVARMAERRGESVPAELRIGIAAFALLPLPLTGHSSNWYWHDMAMMAMELHLVSATAWSGGLAAVIIFLARKPDLLAIALPRFSRLASYCIFIVSFTGLFTGISMLASSEVTTMPAALWTTHYGQLIIAKLVCVAVIAVFALKVRGKMLAQIVLRKPTAVARWCGVELTVMALAYGIAVVLTRSAPY